MRGHGQPVVRRQGLQNRRAVLLAAPQPVHQHDHRSRADIPIMNGLPKDHDGFVRRLAGSLGIQRGHVFRGHASPDNKDRQQQDQPGYGELVLSLSPHVPSGYFRALFNTRTARKPLPALLACSEKILWAVIAGASTQCRPFRCPIPQSLSPRPLEPCSTMCATLRPCACKLFSSAAPSVSPSAPTKRNPPRVFPPPRRPAKSSPIGPSRAR